MGYAGVEIQGGLGQGPDADSWRRTTEMAIESSGKIVGWSFEFGEKD